MITPSKIGELSLGKFKTEILATQDVKTLFKKEKISLATLIPTAWLWYDSELLEAIDENGDGKPDERFGTQFKIIYFSENESLKDQEQQALFMSKTTIKNLNLKYVCLINKK
ncbi:MAG: hypothetical protein KJ592_00340 [Nanoarchaeota archaeon]|nr:hypothetical protein [Nanoarchaeota archaeon]